MKIIKSTDPIAIDHPVFCIFGQPGICKTSLGYSAAESALLLDYDQGSHRAVNRRDTLSIRSWGDMVELIEQPSLIEPYSALVVDTAGRALDLLGDYIGEKNPKLMRDGALTLQGWGKLKSDFRQWLTRLRAMGKDVVLLCHHREEKDGDVTYVRPDLQGASFAEVMKSADFVAYLYMNGRDRVLDFNPTDRWFGKNPAAWAPFKVPPAAKATDFLAGLIVQGREALGKISATVAALTQQVEDWRAQIDTFTTADEFNKAIPEIKKLSATVQPQVAKLLIDHAASLGIAFDKTTRQFTAPVPSVKPSPEPAVAGSLL